MSKKAETVAKTEEQVAAEVAAKAAEKAKKEAEAKEKAEQKAKEKAEAKAAKEVALEKKRAEVKKKQDEAYRILQPKAKEIISRMESAAKSDQKADEHRLAVALILKEAEATCTEMGINFKKWCEAKLGEIKGASGRAIGYETIRKLVAVGKSDNPPLALADMREKNKVANQQHREKKKGAAQANKAAAAVKAANHLNEAPPLLVVKDAIVALGEENARKVIEEAASDTGLVVMTKADAQVAKSVGEGGTLENAQAVFNGLKASDKVKFVVWAASQVGMTAEMKKVDFGTEPELPDALKR